MLIAYNLPLQYNKEYLSYSLGTPTECLGWQNHNKDMDLSFLLPLFYLFSCNQMKEIFIFKIHKKRH